MKTAHISTASRRRIAILGGTGFVGRHLVAHLSQQGHEVSVLTRRRQATPFTLPNVQGIEARSLDGLMLSKHFAGHDTVINLIGILHQQRPGDFQKVHVDLPRQIIIACREAGVENLLHMSALGAAPNAPSAYLRSKGMGENLVHQESTGLRVTSFRPSVIFGRDDSFINRFADVVRIAPVLPLAAATCRFAPVAIEDVVAAFDYALTHRSAAGQRWDLCGAEILDLQAIVRLIAKVLDKRCAVVPLPKALAWCQAWALEHLPGKLLTRDNLLSLSCDSVSDHNALPMLGIHPAAFSASLPALLSPQGTRQRYDHYRAVAR